MARRDIWLLSDSRLWRVRGRLGGDGGQEVSYDFTDEASARQIVRANDEDLGRHLAGSHRGGSAGVQPPAVPVASGHFGMACRRLRHRRRTARGRVMELDPAPAERA
ncbi:hypothetical protein COO58_25970 [Micromonospora sp. WMMA1996]|nr:hypothetical protein COO58_25970 [Micromonospora sp. WMMA1996]